MRPKPLLRALAIGLAIACSDQGPNTVAGRYTLQTVNGEGPPWLESVSYGYEDGLFTESVTRWTNDTLDLNEDATLRWTHVFETMVRAYDMFTGELVDGSVTTDAGTQHGTYTASGSVIELRMDNGAVHTGSWSGDQLTLVAEGYRCVYRRSIRRF